MAMRVLFTLIHMLPIFLSGQAEIKSLRFVFYNVENLFDPFDDPLTLDEDYIHGGVRGWSWNRFEDKVNRIHKVLVALGRWEPPALIGLCEVENYFVLHWLVHETPLRKHGYRIIHQDSPDSRGIDVALLYRPEFFHPVVYHFYPVPGPALHHDPTRDILYVKGIIAGGDSVNLLINHWPSRWEGNLESRAGRMAAAGVLRHILDSLIRVEKQSRIFVAGDFNDEIQDLSLREVLDGHTNTPHQQGRMYFPYDSQVAGSPGSLKYRGRWYGYDLILVSGTLLQEEGLCVSPDGFRIFAPGFLLEEDPQWLGVRPFRTYRGYRYNGGFSDHLPVFIDIRIGSAKQMEAR